MWLARFGGFFVGAVGVRVVGFYCWLLLVVVGVVIWVPFRYFRVVCVTSILARVLWLFEVLWLRCAGIGAAGCGLGGLVGGACSTLCLVFGSVLVF